MMCAWTHIFYLERKIEEEFLRWKEKGPKTALLVKGCRQVGLIGQPIPSSGAHIHIL